MNTVCTSFRSDNGAARRLELSTIIRDPRRGIKGEAQRREGFFSGKPVSLSERLQSGVEVCFSHFVTETQSALQPLFHFNQ